MKVTVDIKFEYDIKPSVEYTGKGKNEKKICDKIFYYIRFHNTVLSKGVITKKDIETISYMSNMGIDFYEVLLKNISIQIINECKYKLNIDVDEESFYNENTEFLVEFIDELKNKVDELMG